MIFLKRKDFFDFLNDNNKKGAALGIDYGSKHIGIAITDSARKYSMQLKTIDFELSMNSDLFQFTENELNDFKSDFHKIEYYISEWNDVFIQLKEIINERKITTCVIGLPLQIKENQFNIKQHVELFAIAFDNFCYLEQLKEVDFDKIKFELELINFKIDFNKENLFNNDFLRKKIDQFSIFLQDERYSSKQVVFKMKDEERQFLYNHYLVNEKFRNQYKRFDEENNKFFRDTKIKKINNLRKFKKFQNNAVKNTKNTNAAVNILNAALFEV